VTALLLPDRCTVCARPGRGLCGPCAASLPPAPDREPPPGLDRCWALLSYEGATPTLVRELKYRNHRAALPSIGTALSVLLADLVPEADGRSGRWAVTWAPTSARRRRERGYDQAELLARAAANPLGLRPRRLLRRRPGPPQTGRHRDERLRGPRFDTRRRPPAGVVVLDDVWTTGATLAAAARELRRAGADEVVGLVLAVRP
jgi:predicted amidophosphoribosyltransferase